MVIVMKQIVFILLLVVFGQVNATEFQCGFIEGKQDGELLDVMTCNMKPEQFTGKEAGAMLV